MKLAVIVLNKTECLDTLLTEFAGKGINGATILESTGMAHALSDEGELRIIASLRVLLDPERQKSKTIFAVIENEQLPLVSSIVNAVTGGLDKPDTGILFATDISYAEGLEK
ncbi:MAG: hypothetical protein Q4C12_00885 [Clostridia bacterium]|nr:hypothetical protein [Clostridia bacterium]